VSSIKSNEINYPKGFKLIRGLCIILGVFGLVGIIYIISVKNPMIMEALQENNQGFWATSFDLLRSLGLLIGAIFIFKLKDYGRKLILISTVLSLTEMIYNTVTSDITFPALIVISIIIPIILDAFIIEYFFNPNIKRFLFEYGNKKTYIEKTFDVKIKKHWINLRYLWYVLFVSLIYSLMVKSFIHEKDTITSFLIGNLVFIIYSILIALIVKWSRYFIFKKKESFPKILFYTSLFECVLFTYYLF